MKDNDVIRLFAERLRALRLEAGLSQASLGEAIGLSKDVASTRINRYEQAVHAPDPATARALADKLGVPLAYFYAEDDRLAALIRAFGQMSERERDQLVKPYVKK